jgi:hypothetical protein
MHFASPVNGKGDVGDLNAKDASKETVLALFGMLVGTISGCLFCQLTCLFPADWDVNRPLYHSTLDNVR